MGYYICGYSKTKFCISKPLTRTMKNIILFDNKVFTNKIFSKSPFDLSICLNENETIKLFIVQCKNQTIINDYLNSLKENSNNFFRINILKEFEISYNNLNFNYDRIYYCLKRDCPYDTIIYRILSYELPDELILIILKYLEKEIIVSFKINKSRRENSYYFCMPSILY